MDSARRAPGTDPAAEAIEFVRYCYRRRRLGWPELYDEMCAVAGRGRYKGWGADELAAVGVGFSLFEMAALAALAARVIAEETAGERVVAAGRARTAAAGALGLGPRTGAEERRAEPMADATSEVEGRGSVLLAPGAA